MPDFCEDWRVKRNKYGTDVVLESVIFVLLPTLPPDNLCRNFLEELYASLYKFSLGALVLCMEELCALFWCSSFELLNTFGVLLVRVLPFTLCYNY